MFLSASLIFRFGESDLDEEEPLPLVPAPDPDPTPEVFRLVFLESVDETPAENPRNQYVTTPHVERRPGYLLQWHPLLL